MLHSVGAAGSLYMTCHGSMEERLGKALEMI